MSITSSPEQLKRILLSVLRARPSSTALTRFFPPLLTSGAASDFQIASELSRYLPAAVCLPITAYQALKHIRCYQQPRAIPFLFNTLVSGFVCNDDILSAFIVFKHAFCDCFLPDKYTFPLLLKSCMKFSSITEAKEIHSVAIKLGFECHLYLQNALVHVYALCGAFHDARSLFDEMPVRDVVSWTGLISGLVKAGELRQAVSLYNRMDVEPNMATLVSVVVACGKLGDRDAGRRIHGLIAKREHEMGVIIGNALIDMYVKCECLVEARQVFNQLPQRDIVSWTSVISGLVQCKHPMDALKVFQEMQESGMEPDEVTLSAVLSACASLGAFDSGKWVHEYIERKGIKWDIHIGTSLVDMYAKCGCLDMAFHTFNQMDYKNVSSWNALLGGLALHGNGKDALVYFDEMVRGGVVPNEVTFIAVLSACTHAGLLDEGRNYFKSMTELYNLVPRIEHYGCMVDLLCKAGLLMEAHQLIRSMPMKVDVQIWGAMLSACKAHGNLELSEEILGHLLEHEPCDSGVYVLLANIFAAKDRWGDVTRIRRIMRKKYIKKEPGSSVIEVHGKAHEFLVGELDHPQMEETLLVSCILAKQVHADWG